MSFKPAGKATNRRTGPEALGLIVCGKLEHKPFILKLEYSRVQCIACNVTKRIFDTKEYFTPEEIQEWRDRTKIEAPKAIEEIADAPEDMDMLDELFEDDDDGGYEPDDD